MEMTFSDYINNPMGKKNSVMSNREMHRGFYSDKFNKIMLRENGKIDYNLYKDGDTYYAHIKVPSEVVEKFYYDVVIMFFPKDKRTLVDRTIQNYNVKFFSNDPAFTFTFAHSFIKNGIFIDDLKDRMSKEAIKKVATERNPKNEVGYVKSLYFAYLFMENKGLFKKIQYGAAPKWNKKNMLSQIMNADEKIELRQSEYNKQQEKKKKKKKDAIDKYVRNNSSVISNTSSKIKNTAKVASNRLTSSISKTSRTVRKSKKI